MHIRGGGGHIIYVCVVCVLHNLDTFNVYVGNYVSLKLRNMSVFKKDIPQSTTLKTQE